MTLSMFIQASAGVLVAAMFIAGAFLREHEACKLYSDDDSD